MGLPEHDRWVWSPDMRRLSRLLVGTDSLGSVGQAGTVGVDTWIKNEISHIKYVH